jgi:hypothetical protein
MSEVRQGCIKFPSGCVAENRRVPRAARRAGAIALAARRRAHSPGGAGGPRSSSRPAAEARPQRHGRERRRCSIHASAATPTAQPIHVLALSAPCDRAISTTIRTAMAAGTRMRSAYAPGSLLSREHAAASPTPSPGTRARRAPRPAPPPQSASHCAPADAPCQHARLAGVGTSDTSPASAASPTPAPRRAHDARTCEARRRTHAQVEAAHQPGSRASPACAVAPSVGRPALVRSPSCDRSICMHA